MERIEKQVVITAPQSAVWQALTNTASLQRWMGAPEMRLAIGADWTAGGAIVITGYLHGAFRGWGTIVRFEPEEYLSYTQLSSLSRLPDVPASYYTVAFALATQASQTVVTLTIDDSPNEVIYKHLNFYWGTTLQLLKRYVEQQQAAAGAAQMDPAPN